MNSKLPSSTYAFNTYHCRNTLKETTVEGTVTQVKVNDNMIREQKIGLEVRGDHLTKTYSKQNYSSEHDLKYQSTPSPHHHLPYATPCIIVTCCPYVKNQLKQKLVSDARVQEMSSVPLFMLKKLEKKKKKKW